MFGDKEDSEVGDTTNHFIGKIRHLLREALDGLLTASDVSILIPIKDGVSFLTIVIRNS